MKHALPVYTIHGTDFIVDTEQLRLYEKNRPENIIPIMDMLDKGDGYIFRYSLSEKNMPSLLQQEEDVVVVKIPQLVTLDPDGMAAKYGYTPAQVAGMSDFEVMVDQDAFKQRQSGRLTTIDIEGHTFFVDPQMDMLRPKDDFLSNGIVFKEIQSFFLEDKQCYMIPYNTKTHEYQHLDLSTITEIPRDVVVVSFPHELKLDPVGYNRKLGLAPAERLKFTGIRPHFKATRVPWEQTGVPMRIQENRNRLKQNAHTQNKTEKPGKRNRPRL